MKIAVIGAGKTGRGFIGRLLQESGQEFLLVDKNQDLIRELDQAGIFHVYFFGDVREPVRVDRYQARTWEQADFSDVELILVSVGGTNLADVGAELKKRLPADKNVYIITAENASKPAEKLAGAIGMEHVAVSESTVFCTTIERSGLDINSENYPYLQFDAERLGGYTPAAANLRPIEGFGNFLTRKLFTYNAASCVIAYLGWLYGYSDYGEAANDPRILELLDRNYAVTNRVLCAEFGYDPEDQAEFAALSKAKFCSRTIVDTVARNAREPQRKLGPGERIVGPMLVIGKHGEDTSVLEMTAAAMLLYDAEGEDAWRQIKAEHTPEEILELYGNLPRDSAYTQRIMAYYRAFQKNG